MKRLILRSPRSHVAGFQSIRDAVAAKQEWYEYLVKRHGSEIFAGPWDYDEQWEDDDEQWEIDTEFNGSVDDNVVELAEITPEPVNSRIPESKPAKSILQYDPQCVAAIVAQVKKNTQVKMDDLECVAATVAQVKKKTQVKRDMSTAPESTVPEIPDFATQILLMCICLIGSGFGSVSFP